MEIAINYHVCMVFAPFVCFHDTNANKEAEIAAEEVKVAEDERLARDGPGEGNLGEMLAGRVDVTILDAPRSLYEPRREVPWGPEPTTGLTVAGTGERENVHTRGGQVNYFPCVFFGRPESKGVKRRHVSIDTICFRSIERVHPGGRNAC